MDNVDEYELVPAASLHAYTAFRYEHVGAAQCHHRQSRYNGAHTRHRIQRVAFKRFRTRSRSRLRALSHGGRTGKSHQKNTNGRAAATMYDVPKSSRLSRF